MCVMRCDRCPLCPIDDACEIAYSELGIEHKDGMCGCRHPYNWAKKKADEYAKYLGEMGEGIAKMLEEKEK